MARIQIPKNSGEFRIIIAMGGNYAACNDKTGNNKLIIPRRDKEQAEEILKRLKEKDHDGEIWV